MVFALLLILIVILLFFLVLKTKGPTEPNKPNALEVYISPELESKDELPIKGAYQRRWMFTYNEKTAYNKLKPIAEGLGYTVFAKVRLLDLLEPVKGTPKYKTYFYKIQAKHVDFVLCDSKLVARYIIELDDESHQRRDRQQRDQFVDEVVESVGYKIIHVPYITDDLKQLLLSNDQNP